MTTDGPLFFRRRSIDRPITFANYRMRKTIMAITIVMVLVVVMTIRAYEHCRLGSGETVMAKP